MKMSKVIILIALVLSLSACGAMEGPETDAIVTAKLAPDGVKRGGFFTTPDNNFILWTEGMVQGWSDGAQMWCVAPSVWNSYEVGDKWTTSIDGKNAWNC